jgi:predicted ester cyclase
VQNPNPRELETTMSDHPTTIATAVGKLNAGDVDGYITTLYHPHAAFHGFPEPFGTGRDGIAGFFRALVEAVPDARIAAEDLFAAGDRVVVRFRLTGTHRGGLLGAAAHGQEPSAEGITVLRFEGDRVAERWNRLDDLTLLTQLGLLPAPTAA